MSKLLTKTKSGIPARDLQLALAEGINCGCGIECECYGLITLKNWNSTTGESDYKAIYLVDGALKVADLATAKAEIDTYKQI